MDPEVVERLRAAYGLDRPLVVQYFDWLAKAVTGDLGLSYTSRSPVMEMIGHALSVTAILAVTSLLVALLFALPLGSIAAIKRGTPTDTVITTITQAFVAIPEYWLAPVLILMFALKLGALPSAGWTGPSSMILPCLTLALRPMSYFTQVTRASMVDVLESPHITASRARGLTFRETMVRHGVRNSLLPVVTLFSVWLAGLLGGSVVVEVIFAVPGMGRLLYDSVMNGGRPGDPSIDHQHRRAGRHHHHRDRCAVHLHQSDGEVSECPCLTTRLHRRPAGQSDPPHAAPPPRAGPYTPCGTPRSA